MKALILAVPVMTLVAMVAGCDTPIEGSYRPYTPGSPAAVLWPSPDADVQPAGYHEAPTTQPDTSPVDPGT
jgi:hypothetical protein